MGRAIPHTSSRATVLDVIRAAGTISRAGLAGATGLTAATVSTVVRGLLADGLVNEVGRAESTGGKPRVLLRLAPASRFAVGVHLDAGGTTYALTDLTGAVVSRTAHVGPRDADPAGDPEHTARRVEALVEGAGVDRERLLGIGLVSAAGGAAGARELERAAGLPVVTGDDATAAALGEYWSGSAGRSSVLVAVHTGAALGAGVLVDGVPYRGAHGRAGGLGHVCVDIDGPPCACGARGCLEAVAGPAAVIEAARAAGVAGVPGEAGATDVAGATGATGVETTDDHPGATGGGGVAGTDGTARASGGGGAASADGTARASGAEGTASADGTARAIGAARAGGGASVTAGFAAVVRAARGGDPAARALLERSARYTAVAVRTLVGVLDPDLVVLTGAGQAVAGATYLPAVRRELEAAFGGRPGDPVRVRLSEFADTAPAIGAAAMVLSSALTPLRTPGLRLPEDLSESGPVPVG